MSTPISYYILTELQMLRQEVEQLNKALAEKNIRYSNEYDETGHPGIPGNVINDLIQIDE